MTNQRQLAIRTIHAKYLYFLLMALVSFKKKKKKKLFPQRSWLDTSNLPDFCTSVGGNGYGIVWESNAMESTWQPGNSQFLFET